MNDAFFSATKHALKNITGVYDMVWPISVGLWNLRYMVAGIRAECSEEVTESFLANKFSAGSGVHGVNYKKAFTDTSWEEQKRNFAWILLNNFFPIYEGWLEELKKKNFNDLDIKKLQYPDKIQNEIARMKNNPSNVLKMLFTIRIPKRNIETITALSGGCIVFVSSKKFEIAICTTDQ